MDLPVVFPVCLYEEVVSISTYTNDSKSAGIAALVELAVSPNGTGYVTYISSSR